MIGKRKSNGYYKDWQNLERDLKQAIRKNRGKFPPHDRLCELGYSTLGDAIYKYHGGARVVRKKMGYDLVMGPVGYYKNWENFEREMNKAIEENDGEFPSLPTLLKLGRGDLSKAISRHQKGYPAVRKKMGYNLVEKPKGYYKQWKNVKKELEKAIEENDGEFPSSIRLAQLRYCSLPGAICKYHGGFFNAREKMGYDLKRRSNGYYKDWQNLERDLKQAIRKNRGKFPSQKTLTKLSYGRLNPAILYHGGFNIVRKKMRYEIIKKSNGYYKNWENFEKEMNNAIGENDGEFPSQSILCKMGKSSLTSAISLHYGGRTSVMERIGYNERKIEELAGELEEIVREI